LIYDNLKSKYGDDVKFVDGKDHITEPIFLLNI